MTYFYLISAIFLGWALGANDSANCFGTAVATRVVRYRHAVLLTAGLVLAGALMEGGAGIEKLGSYAALNGIVSGRDSFLVMSAAAITVGSLTFLKLPISTSQAVIGAIIGSGISEGRFVLVETLQFFGAWFATPLGAMVIGYVLFKFMSEHLQKRINNIELFDKFIKIGFILSGAFSAYALGANNVANITALFVGRIDSFSIRQAVILGGISIALGVLTYSKHVMMTVGKGIVLLDPVSGFVSVLSAALVVYFYAQVGIPVSTSQAIVGAVLGIGIVKGIQTVNVKMIRNIVLAWFGTPKLSFVENRRIEKRR